MGLSSFQKGPGRAGKGAMGARGCARSTPNPGSQAARPVVYIPFPAEEAEDREGKCVAKAQPYPKRVGIASAPGKMAVV